MMHRKGLLILALLALPATTVMAQQKLEWNGTIYTKWLDGDRNIFGDNTGLYNNSEFGNGDSGQGTEFEILFKATVSRQVEIGGRIKARFDSNFWTNGGGFAADENNPRAAQYMKFRGAYVRLTPGYSWIDSATIGSNDWGQFDPFTFGKIRYIDRDNISGLLFQGSFADRAGRYDLARVSIPKLWAGPNFSTGPFHHKDAAYVGQLKGDVSDSLSLTGILLTLSDQEVDPVDTDTRDGVDLRDRFSNDVFAAKFDFTSDYVDVRGAFYYSDSDLGEEFDGAGNTRFTPTLNADVSGEAFKVNIDLNDLPGGLTIAFEYFDFGEDFFSMMAARRESDVLLTEGKEGTWGWSRPDYNRGNIGDGNARNTIGYGGWDDHAHQVMAINADNDFTDFDESMAESVLGWNGFTIVPKIPIGALDLEAEYTYIDYNTNWQGGATGDLATAYHPLMDGVSSWGLGGDWRSPFATFSERETTIMLIKGNYLADIGDGLEIKFKLKHVEDDNERVTDASRLADAYTQSVVESVNYDDREADYDTYHLSFTYQVSGDLNASLIFERHEVELFDGTVDVTTPNMEPWEPEFGWIDYLTGNHEKDKIAIKLSYFLSGMEFGLNAQWFNGEYTPEFFRGENGNVVQFNPGQGENVATALGEITNEKVDLEHYRLKAFMKVQF